MKSNAAYGQPFPAPSSDRRRSQRYDTTLPISIRFLPDGTPVQGAAMEVGPNGMRILTSLPLAETAYLHISFEDASNSTFCEGRIVWTKPGQESGFFESGVDIQRWGGDTPEAAPVNRFPNARLKKDRRRARR